MLLQEYLKAVPKAELHVHLEGAIQPTTALELARRNKIQLPVSDEAELRAMFDYRDFEHFIEVFILMASCLKTSEDFEQVVYEFGAEMARQHVRYAEVTFTPSTHYRFGIPHDIYFSGLQRGRARAWSDFGVRINWIFNIVRQWADPTIIAPLADYATSVAIEGKDDGVVALGLAGIEAGAPPEPFAPYFDRARAAGLHSVPHAGETAGPVSIWGAIRALGAQRIAHGVRAIEDPELVAYLVEHHIPLDITPTSNIRLGVYPSYEAHPLTRLYAAGATITVSTDDPPLVSTTMNDEIVLLSEHFGLDIAAIDEIILNGVRCSFLPEQQRRELEAVFRLEMAEVKREL